VRFTDPEWMAMRDDMAKVIVERPRVRPFSSRKGRRRDLDDLPTREGLRRAAALRGDRKQLNENLAPLRRYLERQVGRPWNKVYSEIAAHLRADSAVQQHVRDHLHDFVAVKPRRISTGWRSRSLWYQPFYVDPRNGLLRRTDQLPEEKRRRRATRHPQPATIERVALSDDRELRRLDGLWYEVEFSPLPKAGYRACAEVQKRPLKPYHRDSPTIAVELIVRRLITPAVYDVVTKAMAEAGPPVDDEASRRVWRHTHPDRRYAIAKRTLSRRELRQYGLSNVNNYAK
jgi:hypothetical protein